jgi:hypothetical protein
MWRVLLPKGRRRYHAFGGGSLTGGEDGRTRDLPSSCYGTTAADLLTALPLRSRVWIYAAEPGRENSDGAV